LASRSVAGGGRRKTKTRTVIGGGKVPRERKASLKDFTKERQAAFLAVLAETCNVSMACRETDTSVTVVYRRRENDAAFRAAWQEALASAYRKLELVLLERSFAGCEKLTIRKDGSEERVREYPNGMAMQLLKLHRDSVVDSEREYSEDETDELRRKILDKLKRLKARDSNEDNCE
jgi:hypothetical protein